jgi:hypothetical protein
VVGWVAFVFCLFVWWLEAGEIRTLPKTSLPSYFALDSVFSPVKYPFLPLPMQSPASRHHVAAEASQYPGFNISESDWGVFCFVFLFFLVAKTLDLQVMFVVCSSFVHNAPRAYPRVCHKMRFFVCLVAISHLACLR